MAARGEAFRGEIRVLPPVRARLSSKASPGALPSRGHPAAGIGGLQPPARLFPALPLPRSVPPARGGSPSGPQSFACPQGRVLPRSRLLLLPKGSARVLRRLGPAKLLASWVPAVLALGGCAASPRPADPPPNPSGTLPLLQAPSPLPTPAAGRPRPRSEPGLLPAGGSERPRLVLLVRF